MTSSKDLLSLSKILELVDCLLGPQGCPWDRDQTTHSLIGDVIEETYELADAIIGEKPHEICEELGDVCFMLILLARVVHKEHKGSLDRALDDVHAKMIRRHPHVFEAHQACDSDAVLSQWEHIKQTESDKQQRTSALDGIPKGLPPLAKAEKLIKKMLRVGYPCPKLAAAGSLPRQESVGRQLWNTLLTASKQGIGGTESLQATIIEQEQAFRIWEQEHKEGAVLEL